MGLGSAAKASDARGPERENVFGLMMKCWNERSLWFIHSLPIPLPLFFLSSLLLLRQVKLFAHGGDFLLV